MDSLAAWNRSWNCLNLLWGLEAILAAAQRHSPLRPFFAAVVVLTSSTSGLFQARMLKSTGLDNSRCEVQAETWVSGQKAGSRGLRKELRERMSVSGVSVSGLRAPAMSVRSVSVSGVGVNGVRVGCVNLSGLLHRGDTARCEGTRHDTKGRHKTRHDCVYTTGATPS